MQRARVPGAVELRPLLADARDGVPHPAQVVDRNKDRHEQLLREVVDEFREVVDGEFRDVVVRRRDKLEGVVSLDHRSMLVREHSLASHEWDWLHRSDALCRRTTRQKKKSEEKKLFEALTGKPPPPFRNLTAPPPYLLLFPSFSCSRAFLLASAIPSETASASDPSAIPLALATSTAALAASRCSASSAAFLDAAAALFALAIAGNRASSLSAATAPPKTPAAPTAKTAQTLLSLAWAAAAACFGRGLAAESASEADRVSISARATGRTGAARGATARQRERAAAVAAAAAAEEKRGEGEVVVFPPFPSSPALAAARPRARARARVPPCRGRSLKVSRSLPEVDAAAVAVGAREAWLFGSLFCAQGGEEKGERLSFGSRKGKPSSSFGQCRFLALFCKLLREALSREFDPRFSLRRLSHVCIVSEAAHREKCFPSAR